MQEQEKYLRHLGKNRRIFSLKDLSHAMAIKHDLDEEETYALFKDAFETIKKEILKGKDVFIEKFIRLGTKMARVNNVNVINQNVRRSYNYMRIYARYLPVFRKQAKEQFVQYNEFYRLIKEEKEQAGETE
jgi:nucleoid DNA-binding protein